MRPDGGRGTYTRLTLGGLIAEVVLCGFRTGAEKDRAGRNSTGGPGHLARRPGRGVSGRRAAGAARVWPGRLCVAAGGRGEQVLVLKTGQAGGPPVAGQACGQDWNLAAGEVLIYSGSASIRIGGRGIRLTGDVLVNGKPVLTGEG